MLENPYSIKPNLDHSKYTSLERLADRTIESSYTIEVATIAYLGQPIPLQTLIEEAWADEKMTELLAVDQNEEGEPCVKKFKSVLSQKKVNLESEIPTLIRLMVKQFNEEKSTLTEVDEIYPFRYKKGPKHCLEAIIEHRPGHHVAHTRQLMVN